MDLKYNKDGLTIEYEWNTWTLKRQIILDLMDLEDNIDGLIIKYERNVGFWRENSGFYGLRIEHRWMWRDNLGP